MVLAVEIDKTLIPILHETLASYDNVEVINEDVLKLDICKIVQRKERWKADQSSSKSPVLYYHTDHYGTA